MGWIFMAYTYSAQISTSTWYLVWLVNLRGKTSVLSDKFWMIGFQVLLLEMSSLSGGGASTGNWCLSARLLLSACGGRGPRLVAKIPGGSLRCPAPSFSSSVPNARARRMLQVVFKVHRCQAVSRCRSICCRRTDLGVRSRVRYRIVSYHIIGSPPGSV
jgi:hypothetical protein